MALRNTALVATCHCGAVSIRRAAFPGIHGAGKSAPTTDASYAVAGM